MDKYKVIYLTGSPATGKTSLCHALKAEIEKLEIVSYYKLVKEYYSEKYGFEFEHEEMRRVSSQKITPDDIYNIDEWMISRLEFLRQSANIIIDSHAVTREAYGFRAVPFRTELLLRMKLDFIVSLYASPDIICKRINDNPEGRIVTSKEEISVHIGLQNALALSYSTTADCHIYFLNSQQPMDALIKWFRERVHRV